MSAHVLYRLVVSMCMYPKLSCQLPCCCRYCSVQTRNCNIAFPSTHPSNAACCNPFSQHLLWQLPYHGSPYTGEAFGFEGLGQTYLSLDVDGRVVRLDSFSKFLAPGMRLGWVTAHPDMLQKICFALHASTMGPCSFTQVQHVPYLQSCMHS